MANADSIFTTYIRGYVDAIGSIRYAHLRRLQPAPYASLGFGGGGTAYVLWRLGLPDVRAWLAASLSDRTRAAYDIASVSPPRSSYLNGAGGLHWMRALVIEDERDRAVVGYLRCARQATLAELADGIAGHLTGARLLLARFDDPRLRRLASELAETLHRRVRARSRRPWLPRDGNQFAHGWTGVLHALLAWDRFERRDSPRWLVTAVHALAHRWRPDAVGSKSLAASWCNGAAGAALLWIEAYRALGDHKFVRAARLAARTALRADSEGSHLCCGLAGVACALLELEAIDPDRGWREQARTLGVQAIQRAAMGWPNGLYTGHPGLVCLARDLVAGQTSGFPAVYA
jgi:eukaryotic-like serine/threonine-protein kinase